MEEKGKYDTVKQVEEALEMLGKGYEPTLEIEPSRTVTQRTAGRLVESERVLHQIFDKAEEIKTMLKSIGYARCEIDVSKHGSVYRERRVLSVTFPKRDVVSIEKKHGKEIIPDDFRWAVFERDNFTCRHCGSRKYLSVDHIIAESKGGKLTMDNAQTLCKNCNSKKGAR